MPTVHRLYQGSKRPQASPKPPPWAFGIPTPKFLKRSRPRQQHHPWSRTISTLQPGVGVDEENLVNFGSGLKSIPSSQQTSGGLESQSPNPKVLWEQHSSTKMPVAPISPTLPNPSQSTAPMRRILFMRSSTLPSSAHSQNRTPLSPLRRWDPVPVVAAAGPISPSVAASSEGAPSSPGSDWPMSLEPGSYETRSTSGSLDVRRILSPPPWVRRANAGGAWMNHTR